MPRGRADDFGPVVGRITCFAGALPAYKLQRAAKLVGNGVTATEVAVGIVAGLVEMSMAMATFGAVGSRLVAVGNRTGRNGEELGRQKPAEYQGKRHLWAPVGTPGMELIILRSRVRSPPGPQIQGYSVVGCPRG